jgi:WRKY transcription factor 22
LIYRGYFRCSSSRECLAKKQVEQKKSDPTIFTVTYFGEHNHSAPTQRNFLTGSTRQKPQVSPSTLRAEEENATPFVIDNFYKDLDKLIDLDEL